MKQTWSKHETSLRAHVVHVYFEYACFIFASCLLRRVNEVLSIVAFCRCAQFSGKRGRAKSSVPTATHSDLQPSTGHNEYTYIRKIDTADPWWPTCWPMTLTFSLIFKLISSFLKCLFSRLINYVHCSFLRLFCFNKLLNTLRFFPKYSLV